MDTLSLLKNLNKYKNVEGKIHSQLIDLLRQSGAKYVVDLYRPFWANFQTGQGLELASNECDPPTLWPICPLRIEDGGTLSNLLNERHWDETLVPRGPSNSALPASAPLPLGYLLSHFPSLSRVLLVDMASQKKRTCHRDSFDRARFLNQDGQNFFLNKYQHCSIVPERIVMYNELHDTDFCLWMQQREWFTLYDVGYHIVVNWVREFYSNMHDVSDNSFKTYVREQELNITPNLLSQVLEIDSVEGAHFPIVNNRQINYNLVAKELTGKPVAWVGGDIAHHKLTESYRLLNIFIRHNVSPKVSKRVTKEDGYLLYCIETQRRVDLPLVVFRRMAKVHNASHNAALPFLGVISKLLVDMGKLAEPNENI
ncbi:hypothetical protein MRB53_016418, partial [Persea americana]